MTQVSIVIPVTRIQDAHKCLDSIGSQKSVERAEIITVSSGDFEVGKHLFDIKNIVVNDINPARRRNEGVANSKGCLIAFIDDDVILGEDWLYNAINFFDRNPQFDILGGPNLLRQDARFAERISDALLKAPFIGSGVLSHSGKPADREVFSPSDVALCNMFVKREAFDKIGGFNEKLGYIGEDTEFLYIAKNKLKSRIFYKYDVAAFHNRRPFPLQYMKQRFLYRVKNGRLLFAYPEIYMKNFKLILFLIGGIVFLMSFFIAQSLFWAFFLLYVVLIVRESARYLKKEPMLSFVLICAFPIHHLTYFAGLIAGLVSGLADIRKLRGIRRRGYVQ